ncbi:MAG: HIT family protein [bacterium]
MYNHEPSEYKCPFCSVVKGEEGNFPYTKQYDIFYNDKYVTGFIASHWWKNNPGHAIVIPNNHIENVYDLPSNLNSRINDLAKQTAIAMKKTYACTGTSLRQHNEPDGDQDVWHYHLHIFPRYKNDDLYLLSHTKKLSRDEDRKTYSKLLRDWFKENNYKYSYTE